MKIPKRIVFRLTFLLAVLFCLGLEVYSDYNTPGYPMELSSDANIADNILNQDVDTFDDNQMNQVHAFSPEVEPLFRLPIYKDLFFLQRYSFSSWEPPKNSGIRI